MIPSKALSYIKNKKLNPAFSWKDVWNEEHANSFTVAKAMQLDVLSDIKDAVQKAIEEGQPFDKFRKELRPELIKKGWWGKKTMTDPLTGEAVTARLGSDRRLKTIYKTNLRSAYQKGVYDRTMESPLHKYFLYRLGLSAQHRQEHAAWEGLILPKDDPFWNSHFPPSDWGCNCFVQALTEERKKMYENKGLTVPPLTGEEKGYTVKVKTERPVIRYRTYINPRKNIIEKVPEGVAPGFNWNPSLAGRDLPLFNEFMSKASEKWPENIDSLAKGILSNQIRKDQFKSFIDKSYSSAIQEHYVTPAGFIDKDIAGWLAKKGIRIGESVTIALESRLIQGLKAQRHAIKGDALDRDAAYSIIDSLLYGQVFFDSDRGKNTLLYLWPMDDKRLVKIAVDPVRKISSRGSSLVTPGIVSVHAIETGGSEHVRITSKLQKIK